MEKVTFRDPRTQERVFAGAGPAVYAGVLDAAAGVLDAAAGVLDAAAGDAAEPAAEPAGGKQVFHFGVDWDWRLTRPTSRAVESHPLRIEDVPGLADLGAAALGRLQALGKVLPRVEFNNCTVTVFPPGTGRAPMSENSLRVPCDEVQPANDEWRNDVDHDVVTRVVSVWLRLPEPPRALHSDAPVAATEVRGAGHTKGEEVGVGVPFTYRTSERLVKFSSLYRARVLSKLAEEREGKGKKKRREIDRTIAQVRREGRNDRETNADIPDMIVVDTIGSPRDDNLPPIKSGQQYFEDGDVSVGDARAIAYAREVRKRKSTKARIDENGNFVGWGSGVTGFTPEFLSERPPGYDHSVDERTNAYRRSLSVRMARATWMEVTFRAINVAPARRANERRAYSRRNYAPAPRRA